MFVSDGPNAANTTTIWFLLALLSTVTIRTARSEAGNSVHPVEFHIVGILLLLTFMPTSYFHEKHMERDMETSKLTKRKQSVVTIMVMTAAMLWMYSLNLWFWWRGIDVLMENFANAPERSGCERVEMSKWAFFFVKVPIDGWYRTFHKVFTVFVIVMLGFVVIRGVASRGVWAMRKSPFGYLVVGLQRLVKGEVPFTVAALFAGLDRIFSNNYVSNEDVEPANEKPFVK